jgi:cytochrome c556
MPTFLSSAGCAAAALVFAVVTTDGRGAQETPPTVRDIMLTMTEPATTAIFAAQSEPPTTDAGWIAVQKAAHMLAESGRLLARPPLTRNDASWTDMAAALVTEAEKTLAVAGKRDADALAEAGDAVYLTCRTCHDRFLAPGQ